MTTFQIRNATADDAAAILGCLHEAFAPYRQQYTADGFHDTTLDERTVRERLKSMTIFVALGDDGEIVGTVGWSLAGKGEGHLRGMAVRSKWQGSGVAKALLEEAESQARAAGCSRMTLDTTLPLQRATRFYRNNGYQPTGLVSDFFGMPLFQYVKRL